MSVIVLKSSAVGKTEALSSSFFRENENTKGKIPSKRPYDPTDNKYRGYKFLWMVTPDFWKPSWGPVPTLGFVRADSEFHARYAAYDKGLLPLNATFGPKVTRQAPKKPRDNDRTKA